MLSWRLERSRKACHRRCQRCAERAVATCGRLTGSDALRGIHERIMKLRVCNTEERVAAGGADSRAFPLRRPVHAAVVRGRLAPGVQVRQIWKLIACSQ